jgi:hypothetical protein
MLGFQVYTSLVTSLVAFTENQLAASMVNWQGTALGSLMWLCYESYSRLVMSALIAFAQP